MNHFQQIYATEAATYHRLVAAEDTRGELAAELSRVAAAATSIVDIGTGTGRIAIPLCQAGMKVHGIDAAPAMLKVAAEQLDSCDGDWKLSVGDARELPVSDGWGDVAIAGWVYGHFTEWWPETWQAELDQALAEMDRVVKSGGVEVVIDTLGTATTEPAAPTPGLAAYHDRLEAMGFARTVLRTDYRFDSVAESIELLDWFFGLGEWGRQHNEALVPEFTGWWERTR
ncbi:MAG: class I SAM-dependent methyltransferase [bacterium]|nr:class I SAM-dependent methyltransferase [bacterium]